MASLTASQFPAGLAVTELRKDWLTGRSMLLAEHRALRPNEFTGSDISLTAAATAPCPFCPGQEANTPPAVFTRNDGAGHWRVRVVPNKFPAVAVDAQSAAGAHEVIIESARHVDRMGQLTSEEFADVLAAYHQRLAHWRASGRFEYGLVFKNLGGPAGASLAHVHSQLIALPQPPQPVAAELARAQQSLAEHGTCPYCRLIADERHAAERVVFDGDGLIAFCPYASLQPCEVWLMPTTHEPWFERRPQPTGSDPLITKLPALLARVEAILPRAAYNLLLRTTPWQADAAGCGHWRIEILPRPAYNLLIRTAPWQAAAANCGHWRIEILPRTNPMAGFELATHIHINPISPTRAAQQLRSS
jgi:UDPglucose--hexose-1-phosphate uridylyltransferase